MQPELDQAADPLSAERRALEKRRWFRQAQAWRTGCEGRISVLKRRHGLNRCRYRGDDGMKRWVGLGVIADNLINIGRVFPSGSGRLKKIGKKRIGRTSGTESADGPIQKPI